MQKQKLEILSPKELLKELEDAFRNIPIVPRDCVKALNKLIYNMNHQTFTPQVYQTILSLVLRGFTSKDNYLKSVVYAVLESLSVKTSDGIIATNSILKEIDDKSTPTAVKNSALRTLFSNSSTTIQFEFEKYIKTALIDPKTRDNAVCIASEYFKDIKIDSKVSSSIEDYHLGFFNRLPINKYTSMLEIRKIVKNHEDIHKIGQYLTSSTDNIIFLEAAKALTLIRQEMAAPYIDKAISTLRLFLKRSAIEQFAAMKILSKLSVIFPTKVARANREIEDLVHDPSKTVSMLAILTLLKTGTDETAKQLSSKLEPLMNTMSEPYKIMAVETIEKLTRDSKTEYIMFLKSSLTEKGSVEFKRFILKKLESLLATSEESRKEIMKFLCSYIEDPEHYQVSMEIVGLLSQYLTNIKDLTHVYNRLILDNAHVRNCVYQTLFDLSDKLDTIGMLKDVFDPDTKRMREFLYSNAHISKGSFDIDELSDLKDEVLKYLHTPAVKDKEHDMELPTDGFIKECRSISLTADGTDFSVSVVKKVFVDKVILCFTFISRMSRIIVNSCVLALESESGRHLIEVDGREFKGDAPVVKEINLELKRDDVMNGVLEYDISPEDDVEESDRDSVSLIPFDINILDFIRPIAVNTHPTKSKTVEPKFKLKATDAVSKVVGVCNMHLNADKDSFVLEGYYEDKPVVLKGNTKQSKYTTISIEICCDDEDLINEIANVFD